MPSACGVSWNGTSGGKLDRSAIPNDDYESHFLNDGDTKSDSSFPVVDGDGTLRAGNVNSAWDMRNRGEGVSEECLRKLDDAFEDDVLPDSAYENAGGSTVSVGEPDADDDYGLNLEFSVPSVETLADGFNQYGVRENEDGSVDVRFDAMETGVRRGIEVNDSFLSNVVSHEYDRIPVQLDHSKSQMANAGYIQPENMQFNGDMLQLQLHVPNTGSSVRDDIIADFTHEPPQITDGSVAFDPQTVEVESPMSNEDNPKFVDARIREFSLTPFPAGYDNGGITPAFSEAIEQAATFCECDDAESQLTTKTHTLRKYD